MPAQLSVLDRLLDEMARGAVVPESYSTKSFSGKVEQLLLTAILAVVALVAGMLLGGAGRAHTEGGSIGATGPMERLRMLTAASRAD